jgi:hypothetical protein
MVNPYLVGAPAAGAGALLVVKSIFKNKENNVKKGEKEQRRGTVTDDEASFACERVCASDRLLKRMGGLAKVNNNTHKTPLSLSRVTHSSSPDGWREIIEWNAVDAIPRLNESEQRTGVGFPTTRERNF